MVTSSYDSDEDNPELHPLTEALDRAARRRDDATGIREALEAEAQEVAQLAVNAENALNTAKKQVEEAELELAAANASVLKLEDSVIDITQRMRERQQQQQQQKSAIESMSSVDGGYSSSNEASDGEEGEKMPTKVPTLEDRLWDKSQQLGAASARVKELEGQIVMLQAKLFVAQQTYDKADSIAAAAMEAAEEAVKDEMECITVFKETESALTKAIEDIKNLYDTSERREEEFDKKAAAQRSIDAGGVATASIDEVLKKEEKTYNFEEDSEDEDGQLIYGRKRENKLSLKRMARQLTVTAARRPMATTGVVALACVAAFVLHQQGVFTAIASVAHTTTATVAKLWAVAVELFKGLPWPHVHESEAGLLATIWLLLASVLTVPLICKMPGGSPVLGFLAGGALIGPYALGIIQDVESIRHLAELGVVFLLFNIGLELSFDRLRSMGKFVFGMGTAQVVLTLAAVAYTALGLTGGAVGGPGAIILGGGLALSTTAVGMQVLQDRGETGSRHGRAAFSVLLLQDLAVVVLLMLVPLLAPSPDGSTAGLAEIAKAIGFASLKAVGCMVAIVVAGRTLLQPLYRRVADTKNADVFAALTLLVVLGTSFLTQIAGLSLALGAFLAGLLLAETEYHIQVESDIAPYKGLLMGLFFMTVGMEFSVGLLIAKFKTVIAATVLLIVGKVAIMTAVGQAFGLSLVQSLRSGLLLSPGGEFAFVLFGEAMARGIMGGSLVRELFLVVALSMALTPFLAEFGSKIARMFEKSDLGTLQPKEGEMSGMSGHVIIAGFGRVGRLIAQMLSEQLIPFVALDSSIGRVQEGKALDLPVYFGDAGSAAVLHAIGADRAACAIITLDTPGSNYRSVYAMHKHFPHVKTFVRARDIDSAIMLERAGATAVVPETLEPSLQLGAAVLSEFDLPEDEVADVIRSFRKSHLAELQYLAQVSGTSLGYGTSREKGSDNNTDSAGDEGVESSSNGKISGAAEVAPA